MWVISGSFDGATTGDVSFQKEKLLKPNSVYTVGRKNRALVVNNKKVSHDHCRFIVGPHSADDARDPNKRPTLEVTHDLEKNRVILVKKDLGHQEGRSVEAQQRATIEPGDYVCLVTSVYFQIHWRPICAYAHCNVKPPIPIDDCASLGIKLFHTLQENVTHHLVSHYAANLSIATSLLALAKIVKPEWLLEILRLGNLPRESEQSQTNGISLEDHFVLPLESKYRPSFSPALLPSQKVFEIWQPNEERVNFFAHSRFICLQEKSTLALTELKEAIHRGGGTLEVFDIHAGVPRLRKALSRSHAKEGKRTVIVGDVDGMQAAIGRDEWAELVKEAKSYGLDIFPPSKVVQSVLEVKLDLLESTGSPMDETPSSPLPDVVPNSIPEEQTIPPRAGVLPEPEAGPSNEPPAPPRRKLVRRVTSREPSEAPSLSATPIAEGEAQPAEDVQPAVKPRRVLTRRVFDPPPANASQDDAEMRSSPPPAAKTAPTPARKLKRRVGVPGSSFMQTGSLMSGLGETYGGSVEDAERPTKKFKALFDASDPDAVLGTNGSMGPPADPIPAESYEVTDSIAPFASASTQTQTDLGTQTAAGRHPLRSMGASSLAILREEEEETQSTVPPGHPPAGGARANKRTLDAVDEDAEMDIDGESRARGKEGAPAAKRRALENSNAVNRTDTTQAQPPSTTQVGTQKQRNPGAPPNKPDTDAAFLKALASTKRGKKTEDEFDREFNKLKISKPKTVDEEREAQREREEEEWAILAEFGNDEGLRGNFMVVVEMDVPERNGEERRRAVGMKDPRWEGKPNFKKFKKKIVGTPRAKVELVLSDNNDYGMGSAYWKGGSSQTQTQNFRERESQSQMDWQSHSQSQSQPEYSQQHGPATVELASQATRSKKPPSKAGSTAGGRSQRTTAKSQPKSQPKPKTADALFLDSDDEDEDNFRGFGDEDSQRSRPRRGASEAVLDRILEREPDDDEETLRSSAGTSAQKGKTSSSKPPSKAATKPPAPAPAATRKSTRSGTGTGKTATAAKPKKPAPIIADDDSDDGAVFRGF